MTVTYKRLCVCLLSLLPTLGLAQEPIKVVGVIMIGNELPGDLRFEIKNTGQTKIKIMKLFVSYTTGMTGFRPRKVTPEEANPIILPGRSAHVRDISPHSSPMWGRRATVTIHIDIYDRFGKVKRSWNGRFEIHRRGDVWS
jgi:hypothetical protein